MGSDRMFYKGLRRRNDAGLEILEVGLRESGYEVSSNRVVSGQLARKGFYIDDFGFVAFDNKAGENGRHKYVAVGEANSLLGKNVYCVRGHYNTKNSMENIARDVEMLPERGETNIFSILAFTSILFSPDVAYYVSQKTHSDIIATLAPLGVVFAIGGLAYLGRKIFEAYLRTEGVEYGASAIRSILEDDINADSLHQAALGSIRKSKAMLVECRAKLDRLPKKEDEDQKPS